MFPLDMEAANRPEEIQSTSVTDDSFSTLKSNLSNISLAAESHKVTVFNCKFFKLKLVNKFWKYLKLKIVYALTVSSDEQVIVSLIFVPGQASDGSVAVLPF